MTLEQILAIITPILSGLGGVLSAVLVFVVRIRSVVKVSKEAIKDNEDIKEELRNTKSAFIELNQKVNFLVEEAKKAAKDAKQEQK